MNKGDKVSMHVDELEYIGKYAREIGTVIGVDLKNTIITVQFEDGQIMYFHHCELQVEN